MALEVSDEAARKLVRRDVDELAPKMRNAVRTAIARCTAAGHPVTVYEALRSDELARMYFELKRSKARNGYYTWHFYGLAVDIIHPDHGWSWWDSAAPEARAWRSNVVKIFKACGMDWGGDFKSFPDAPHFHWERCKPSPSKESIRLYETAGGELPGREAVWHAVGAD